MENGDIPDVNIVASSELHGNYAWQARLNYRLHTWGAEGNQQPWIQADIGYQTYVSGVVTQGDGKGDGGDDYVSSIKVSTFLMSSSNEEVYVKDGEGKLIVSSYRFIHNCCE